MNQREFVWYDNRENRLLVKTVDIADVLMMILRENRQHPSIKKIEISSNYKHGRLIGADDSICEYIGEL